MVRVSPIAYDSRHIRLRFFDDLSQSGESMANVPADYPAKNLTLRRDALRFHDWDTLCAIDFDKWACATYRVNFPDVRVECASVSDWIDRLPSADIILGGPPCQPFSSAGEGDGENDERDCIPDFIAAVTRVKPRMFLMENVSGLLQAKHYWYFCRAVESLNCAGYVVQWRLLDAVSFGVPQFRSRVWVWGIRSDLHGAGMRHAWPVPTHVWPPPQGEGLFGVSSLPAVTVGQALGIGNGEVRQPRGLGGGKTLLLIQSQPAQSIELPSPTLRSGGNGHDGCCLRIIGGGRNHPADAEGKYRRDKRDLTNDPCTTIVGLNGATTPICAVGSLESHDLFIRRMRGDERRDHPTKPSPAITVSKGGGETPLFWHRVGPVPRHWSTVVKNWSKGTPYGCVKWKQTPEGLWIRRLHVLECARLQSVPDDFQWPENMPKTHGYRVVGNGQASLMVHRLSEAMAKVDPESRTIISLFCGGGIGDVGFHGRFWSYDQEIKNSTLRVPGGGGLGIKDLGNTRSEAPH